MPVPHEPEVAVRLVGDAGIRFESGYVEVYVVVEVMSANNIWPKVEMVMVRKTKIIIKTWTSLALSNRFANKLEKYSLITLLYAHLGFY